MNASTREATSDQQRVAGRRRPSRPVLLGAVAASVVLGILATLGLGPRPPQLSGATTGDQALAAQVRSILGEPAAYRGLAVALVGDGQVRLAGLGQSGDQHRPEVDQRTRFEAGSIGKALTGMLLADLAAAGEVDLDQPVADLVPGTPLAATGDATLAELASHRSGLPNLSIRPGDILRSTVANLAGADPYMGTPEQVLSLAADMGPAGGAESSYSNLGGATLGNALAAHQGKPYPDLLRERLLAPLSMADTTVATDSSELPQPRASGVSRAGRGQQPWIAEGYAGAGIGLWSTTANLARLATAILEGTAPGIDALEPRWPHGEDQIGLGWLTSQVNGRTIAWHNGGTGGFRSYLGIDRDAGRAVVVLATSTQWVDDLGQRLLTEGTP